MWRWKRPNFEFQQLTNGAQFPKCRQFDRNLIMEIRREVFDEQRRPRFGNDNPERMRLAFWEWMIRGEENPKTDEESGLAGLGFIMREGKLKSGYGPYRARDLFKVPINREDGPIWTFERYGATRNQLSDGRVVCIGGEHEDYYDADFCIYNDVIVFGPEDQIEIYGYPKEVFPPTDFHTASLLTDRIIIIGSLGYMQERHPGHTPVYSFDLSGYHMSEIKTSGEMPGWISEHESVLGSDGIITIRGGKIIEQKGGKQQYRRNVEDYALDLRSGVWSRLTNRNWRQFSIRQEDSQFFVLERGLNAENLIPRAAERTVAPDEESNRVQIVASGVPISLIVGVSSIEIIFEGEMPGELCLRLAEEIRANAEAAIKHACVLEER